MDLTLNKILTNGVIPHERLLNLTTAALLGIKMFWGCKLLKGCYWLFIECILGWSCCRANFLSLWNIYRMIVILLSPSVFWLLQGLLIFLLHCIRNSEVSFSNKLFLEVTRKWPINPFELCFSVLIFFLLNLMSSFCSWLWPTLSSF